MSDIEQQVDMPWGNVTVYKNGNIVAETQAIIIAIGNDGNSNVTFKLPVASIALENILDIQHHNISSGDDETIHTIAFKDGGTFYLSYGQDGYLKNLSGSNIQINISNDGQIRVAAGASDQSPLHTATSG
jgi:hypothetical protein